MENAVGKMLRVGVLIAGFVVFAGGVFQLRGTGSSHASYRVFHPQTVGLAGVASGLGGVFALNGHSWLELGILLLIATPILRVMFCVVGFAAQKDGLYVLVSGIVLAVLIYSFFFRT